MKTTSNEIVPCFSQYASDLDTIIIEENKRIARIQTCLEMSKEVLDKARRLLDGTAV